MLRRLTLCKKDEDEIGSKRQKEKGEPRRDHTLGIDSLTVLALYSVPFPNTTLLASLAPGRETVNKGDSEPEALAHLVQASAILWERGHGSAQRFRFKREGNIPHEPDERGEKRDEPR